MQRQAFLSGEGDAWFARNRDRLGPYSADPVAEAVKHLGPTRVLEIGCSSGWRLEKLNRIHDASCVGVDPSMAAVTEANKRFGVSAFVGTAESLPFRDRQFDLVIFGFCLYLCDREDLFAIASEADRVLGAGHLVIYDFDAPPSARPYSHRPGVFSYRLPYASMFLWHPAYSLVSRTNVRDDEYVTVLKKA